MGQRIEIAALNGHTVLVADRSPQMRSAIRRLLGEGQVVWDEVDTLQDLAAALDRIRPSLTIVEDHLLGVGQVLRHARQVHSFVIVVSSSGKRFPDTTLDIAYVDRLHLAERLPAVIRGLYGGS